MTNKNFVQWDAVHYFKIKNHGYIVADEERRFYFAFSFIPFNLKLTNLPPLVFYFLITCFFQYQLLFF